MRFTIEGFRQSIMLELDLDPIDALILRWHLDNVYLNQKLIDNQIYSLISFEDLIKDLPCLYIKNIKTIENRFEHYCKAGLLTRKYLETNDGIEAWYSSKSLLFSLMYDSNFRGV